MATSFLLHEKVWFDKFKYDDAERRFYEQMNGPAGGSARQEDGASVILRDIARARENIQKSLAGLRAALSSPPEGPGRAAPGTVSPLLAPAGLAPRRGWSPVWELLAWLRVGVACRPPETRPG
ncbi:PREDICTED: elongation factor 1-delta-like, partial [Condylura cristata]|uniref:elongation factor 1-delta-like n=1 Tax=Condylura cristata TaxID=143302 RepID=UPI00064307F1